MSSPIGNEIVAAMAANTTNKQLEENNFLTRTQAQFSSSNRVKNMSELKSKFPDIYNQLVKHFSLSAFRDMQKYEKRRKAQVKENSE
jgi:hypothetical protein